MLKLHVLKPRDTWKVPPDVGPSSRTRWPLDFSTVTSGADLIVIDATHHQAPQALLKHMPGPCYAHFNTRYAIGTHAAGWDEIEEFSTSAAHGFYIHDNEYTMAAAQELRNCISFRCCPTQVGDPPAAVTWWNPTIAGTSCKVTTGKYGATDAAFANHDALSD